MQLRDRGARHAVNGGDHFAGLPARVIRDHFVQGAASTVISHDDQRLGSTAQLDAFLHSPTV
jgi:hypothetical protein